MSIFMSGENLWTLLGVFELDSGIVLNLVSFRINAVKFYLRDICCHHQHICFKHKRVIKNLHRWICFVDPLQLSEIVHIKNNDVSALTFSLYLATESSDQISSLLKELKIINPTVFEYESPLVKLIDASCIFNVVFDLVDKFSQFTVLVNVIKGKPFMVYFSLPVVVIFPDEIVYVTNALLFHLLEVPNGPRVEGPF